MRIAILLLALVGCQSSDVSRSLGARCDLNSDCDQKCLGPDGDWPGGFCTTVCDTNDQCGGGGVCIEEQGGGLCAFSCSVDDQCLFLGSGYTCMAVDGHTGGRKVMACRG